MEKIKQDLHGLQAELATKNGRIQSLETSDEKLQLVSESLASEIFKHNKKQKLRVLLDLDPLELFNKYDEMIENTKARDKDSYNSKYEEINDKLSNNKLQLSIQMGKREAIEKQHSKVMEIINNVVEKRNFENILPAIASFK